jgi:hypothetical protein
MCTNLGNSCCAAVQEQFSMDMGCLEGVSCCFAKV